jgi:outer membrane protein TolC
LNGKPELPVLDAGAGLSNYLQYALLNSPQVEEAYFNWAASVERVTTVRSFPDPQLTFQMDIQDIVTSIMPGVMMTFPGLGKRHAGAEVATADSQSRYYTFQSRVFESALMVKRAYYQLSFLTAKVRVNENALTLLNDLERLARSRNEIGKATLQDALTAQMEQARLKTQITNLVDSKSSLLAQFKASLGIHGDQPAPPLPNYCESSPQTITPDALLQSVLTHNPRIKAMEAEVRSAESAIRLADKARMPDSSLGLMVDPKMSPVLVRPLVGVTLPIWRDKLAAQLAEAQANKGAAQARLSNEQINLAVEVAEKSCLYRETVRNLELLQEELLPKTQQSLEIARSGYVSGQLGFNNLIDTERALLGLQLEEIETRTQRELVLAELSGLLAGTPSSDAQTVLSVAP